LENLILKLCRIESELRRLLADHLPLKGFEVAKQVRTWLDQFQRSFCIYQFLFFPFQPFYHGHSIFALCIIRCEIAYDTHGLLNLSGQLRDPLAALPENQFTQPSLNDILDVVEPLEDFGHAWRGAISLEEFINLAHEEAIWAKVSLPDDSQFIPHNLLRRSAIPKMLGEVVPRNLDLLEKRTRLF